MASSFKLDASNLLNGLASFQVKAESAMYAYVNTAALKMQNYARNYAPWTDRTAHARQRLTAKASRTATGFLITLSHGVDYGLWLELANEKNYAIIDPTIKIKSPEIMKGFNSLLERMK